MRESSDRTDAYLEEPEPAGGEYRGRFLESILDNLSAWAFIALAIAALFMVWATLVIVETYVGELPAVKP